MNSKDITGIAVISIAEGKKLGTVERVYLDPDSQRVVGFAVGSGGGLLSTQPGAGLMVDVTEVHSLGPDALTLDEATAARGAEVTAAAASLLPLDDLTKRKVVTEGGTYVGQVASLEFDERSFRLTEVEVSPGFFRGNVRVPAEHLISIGQDVLVVGDAVCAAPDPSTIPSSTTPAESPQGRWVVGDVTATGTQRPPG